MEKEAQSSDQRPTWYQKKSKPLLTVGTLLLIAGFSIFLVNAYNNQWAWTGFIAIGDGKTATYQPEKTLWDWMQLLIIPVVLTIGGYLFNVVTSRNEQDNTRQRDLTERAIATDNQREAALQSYIDKISELLLDDHLDDPAEKKGVRHIARIRTLTVLRRLDAERKGDVLQFLCEAGLIKKDQHIIDLEGADLSDASLNRANLSDANLTKSNLTRANLRGANLARTDLTRTDLTRVNLTDANLSDADLTKSNLCNANLIRANLRGANLTDSDLREANLRGVNLNRTNLTNADLTNANFREANLRGALQLHF